METTIVYWGYIGIMEKRMETSIVYWGYPMGFIISISVPGLSQRFRVEGLW